MQTALTRIKSETLEAARGKVSLILHRIESTFGNEHGLNETETYHAYLLLKEVQAVLEELDVKD